MIYTTADVLRLLGVAQVTAWRGFDKAPLILFVRRGAAPGQCYRTEAPTFGSERLDTEPGSSQTGYLLFNCQSFSNMYMCIYIFICICFL